MVVRYFMFHGGGRREVEEVQIGGEGRGGDKPPKEGSILIPTFIWLA